MSEDCLQVNVWTPALANGGNRAVLFIIHVGGYSSGSGNLESQHMAKLANMAVVALTHRPGAPGYLGPSAFGGKVWKVDQCRTMDLVQAVEWVRDNIANFGSDPDNATITRQFGGGKCRPWGCFTKSLSNRVPRFAGGATARCRTGLHVPLELART